MTAGGSRVDWTNGKAQWGDGPIDVDWGHKTPLVEDWARYAAGAEEQRARNKLRLAEKRAAQKQQGRLL